jgi:hypothetical protein
MERRHFLRSILGVAAATALPSEVRPKKFDLYNPLYDVNKQRSLTQEELVTAFVRDYSRQLSVLIGDAYPALVDEP